MATAFDHQGIEVSIDDYGTHSWAADTLYSESIMDEIWSFGYLGDIQIAVVHPIDFYYCEALETRAVVQIAAIFALSAGTDPTKTAFAYFCFAFIFHFAEVLL